MFPDPLLRLLTHHILFEPCHPAFPINLQEIIHGTLYAFPLGSLKLLFRCTQLGFVGMRPGGIGGKELVEFLESIADALRHDVAGLVDRAEGETGAKEDGEERQGDAPDVELGSGDQWCLDK
jgi:hypothetical protein